MQIGGCVFVARLAQGQRGEPLALSSFILLGCSWEDHLTPIHSGASYVGVVG